MVVVGGWYSFVCWFWLVCFLLFEKMIIWGSVKIGVGDVM